MPAETESRIIEGTGVVRRRRGEEEKNAERVPELDSVAQLSEDFFWCL